VPVVAVAGEVLAEAAGRIEAVSLVERFGAEKATGQTIRCVEEVVAELLERVSRG
jgi:hypothetical protein